MFGVRSLHFGFRADAHFGGRGSDAPRGTPSLQSLETRGRPSTRPFHTRSTRPQYRYGAGVTSTRRHPHTRATSFFQSRTHTAERPESYRGASERLRETSHRFSESSSTPGRTVLFLANPRLLPSRAVIGSGSRGVADSVSVNVFALPATNIDASVPSGSADLFAHTAMT